MESKLSGTKANSSHQSAPADRRGQDQVARVVDRYFQVTEQELQISGCSVANLIQQFGSPLYVYDQQIISQKISEVRRALPQRFELYYSIKANPNAEILRIMLAQHCGLEVASAGELQLALAAGCQPTNVIFAGPGKTERELAHAVQAGIGEIHVESIEEARWIHALSRKLDRVCPIALRVNPNDSAGGAMRMGGKPSPFGIDEEQLDPVIDEIKQLSHVKIQGVHQFMGTQILDASILLKQYRRAIELAGKIAGRLGEPLKTLDFGGGWGTPYFPHESELDLAAVAEGLKAIDSQMTADPHLCKTSAIIEPGRFLVNESGVYLTKVTRIKHSRGKLFAVIDGGMHHHLAASGNLGQTIKRNFPLAIVNKLGVQNEQSVEITGPLCTPLDTLGRSISLPAIAANDIVGVFLSGAYARASSPLGFLSHNAPAEVLVQNGLAKLIRRCGKPEDYLADQIPPPTIIR